MSLTDRVLRRVSIDIDLAALQANLAQLRRCSPTARFFSVLKSDAYGHGAVACAEALADTDGFAVVHIDEARQLRDAGIAAPILVLQGATSVAEMETLANLDCALIVHDASQCRLLELARFRQPVTIWLKVDTGMGRLGFSCAEVTEVAQRLSRTPDVRLYGLISHLACADETANPFSRQQATRFQGVVDQLPDLATSLANSAGVLAWSGLSYDWVRPGIALYGSNPLDIDLTTPLQPVMRVSAPLIACKNIRRGDGIGYAQSYVATEDMRVGYAAIGYGDGLPRRLSGAVVQVAGQPAAVLGRISMDSIALDLRHVTAKTGDEVLLWGPGLPVEKLAVAADTIGYELLCSIRGHRRYSSADR